MDQYITLRYWTQGELQDVSVELADRSETVAQLLRRLASDSSFGDLNTLFHGDRYIGVVVINGRIVDYSKIESLTLRAGDLVKLLRPVSGG